MLTNKAAVVTGSTSGIGLAIARGLASHGADIVLNGFGNAREIEKLRVNIELEFDVKAHYLNVDLSTPEGARSLISQATDVLGAVDILVNNAGIQHTDPTESFPVERWDAVIALNLSAVFHTTAAALPKMQEKGWGRIINIASAHGLVASEHKAAYVAAKHGVVGLSKVVALENAGNGITCNAICPGWVRTPLVEAQIVALAKGSEVDIETAAKMLLSEKQPSLQFVTPEQIAGAAVFMCTEAADQMTGTSLSLDGGWTAR
ncbi:3-hydroxybutyrate dehydrogenase [Paenalcaligenes niemegkensis]|uniref:3-hydroxybutyrate dehydrogenase n=1 Tax=Paenalcaligenes niemegkensis TaxID=2895469 RepID=UPI002151CBB0|nr:3-hydroxybutyrate dehydrogenase [Paenalcaligenes niemegkensis]